MSTSATATRRRLARLLDCPAPLWRTEPRYQGLCSDGFFQTPDGRVHYRPPADVPAARARLDLLLLDEPTPLPRPPLSARAIDGRLPSPSKVHAIEAAMDQVPAAILARLLRAGARIELIPGRDVAAHPQFAQHKGKQFAGVARFLQPFAVVAVDADDPVVTVLHELGHLLDNVAGHPSRSAGWFEIWTAEKRAGRVSRDAGQQQSPSEFFAEQFARLWHPDLYPTRGAQDFIMQLV